MISVKIDILVHKPLKHNLFGDVKANFRGLTGLPRLSRALEIPAQ